MSFKLSIKWFGGFALLFGGLVVLWAQVVVRWVH
jgi:hypothetical protein